MSFGQSSNTTGEIINRSGTKFNSGYNKDLALQDAETRLQSGGGLFGSDGLGLDDIPGVGGKKSIIKQLLRNASKHFFWKSIFRYYKLYAS